MWTARVAHSSRSLCQPFPTHFALFVHNWVHKTTKFYQNCQMRAKYAPVSINLFTILYPLDWVAWSQHGSCSSNHLGCIYNPSWCFCNLQFCLVLLIPPSGSPRLLLSTLWYRGTLVPNAKPNVKSLFNVIYTYKLTTPHFPHLTQNLLSTPSSIPINYIITTQPKHIALLTPNTPNTTTTSQTNIQHRICHPTPSPK